MKSLLVNFIKNNPLNWAEGLAEKHIAVKFFEDYAIFNYTDLGADFFDPIVREARGIIIDMTDKSIACRPFDKFGNWQESYAAEIDWDSARVQEKLDGSIIKLWYGKRLNQWMWSTNSMIDAAAASFTQDTSFLELIHRAANFKDIDFSLLNKDHTYIFELVSHDAHVVKYKYTKLFFIGERDNETGEEFKPRDNKVLNISHPMEYPLTNFDACIKMLESFNKDGSIEHEGFVVVDKNWNRIKMKNDEYIAQHRIKGNNGIAKDEDIVAMLLGGDRNLYNLFCSVNLRNKTKVKLYDYYLAALEEEIQDFIDYARDYYAEMSYDRKATALKIKGNKYAAFGFRALNEDISAIELIKECRIEKILNYIERL